MHTRKTNEDTNHKELKTELIIYYILYFYTLLGGVFLLLVGVRVRVRVIASQVEIPNTQTGVLST